MTQLEGKKILVTGGAGFIGFHLTKKLLDIGADVTTYDNLSNTTMQNVKDNPKA
jgi:nucleoside-diphosphate-sugar epimerase